MWGGGNKISISTSKIRALAVGFQRKKGKVHCFLVALRWNVKCLWTYLSRDSPKSKWCILDLPKGIFVSVKATQSSHVCLRGNTEQARAWSILQGIQLLLELSTTDFSKIYFFNRKHDLWNFLEENSLSSQKYSFSIGESIWRILFLLGLLEFVVLQPN